MSRNANVSRKSSTPKRSAVRSAALSKGRRGQRDQSDCGPEHHHTILPPIEVLFLDAQPEAKAPQQRRREVAPTNAEALTEPFEPEITGSERVAADSYRTRKSALLHNCPPFSRNPEIECWGKTVQQAANMTVSCGAARKRAIQPTCARAGVRLAEARVRRVSCRWRTRSANGKAAATQDHTMISVNFSSMLKTPWITRTSRKMMAQA